MWSDDNRYDAFEILKKERIARFNAFPHNFAYNLSFRKIYSVDKQNEKHHKHSTSPDQLKILEKNIFTNYVEHISKLINL